MLYVVIGAFVVSALISVAIAANNGRSIFGFLLLGLILGPLSIAVALILGKTDAEIREQAFRSGSLIKCPACAEDIKSEAKVCRCCRYVIEKHVWTLKVSPNKQSNCPRCYGSVQLNDDDIKNENFDCPRCKRHVLFKIGETIKNTWKE